MQHVGKLQSWNDERGFGFIAPTHGGVPLFVHISAFPADGSRPTVGEHLSYEPGRGADGRPQAVRAWRQALGRPGDARRAPALAAPRRRGLPGATWMLVLTLVLGLGAYGYRAFDKPGPGMGSTPPSVTGAAAQGMPLPAVSRYRCDGRTHCSQMASCEEATYFLQHCPGTQMDGDHDGVPCEQQFCGGR